MGDDLRFAVLSAVVSSVLIIWPIYRFVKLDAPAIMKARMLIRYSRLWLFMCVFYGTAIHFHLVSLFDRLELSAVELLVMSLVYYSLVIVTCADTRIRVRMERARQESPPPPNNGIMSNS